MKKKPTKKKAVKAKRTRKKRVTSPEQWGKEFEAMAHREPLEFNFIHAPLSKIRRTGINGDPFSMVGNEESVSLVDFLRPVQRKVNERESHLTDALRYATMPGLNSQCSTGNVKMTRGELGTAPAHYSNGKYTPWEIVDDWKLDYYCGNALKYVCRHKHKGTPVQDIQKAIDCLIKYKQNLEKETT